MPHLCRVPLAFTVLGLIACGSTKPQPPRLLLPAPPADLPEVEMVTPPGALAELVVAWHAGARLHAEGRPREALLELDRATALHRELVAQVEADGPRLAWTRAAICWGGDRPRCALDEFGRLQADGRDEALAIAAARAEPIVRRAVADHHLALAAHHDHSGDARTAGCHRAEAARLRPELGIVPPIDVSAPRCELADPPLGTAAIPDANHSELHVLALQAAIAAQAVLLVDAAIERRARLAESLARDELALRLAVASAWAASGDNERAIAAYERARFAADEKARTEIEATLQVLKISLAFDRYRVAADHVRAERWPEALTGFRLAEAAWSHPIHHLGMAAAFLKLDPGFDPIVRIQLGPEPSRTPLEEARAAYQRYLDLAPGATDRRSVEKVVVAIDAEIAIRRSGERLRQQILALMAAQLVRSWKAHARRTQQYAEWNNKDFWRGPVQGIRLTHERPPERLPRGARYFDSPPTWAGAPGAPAPDVHAGVVPVQGAGSMLSIVYSHDYVPPIVVMPAIPGITVHTEISAGMSTTSPMLPTPDLAENAPALPDGVAITAQQVGRSIDARALEPGDVIVSTTPKLLSAAIRALMGSEVSHAMMYVGHGHVIEAVGEGVILRPLHEALAGGKYAAAFRHRRLTDPDPVVRYALGKLGKKFDHWGLVTHPRFGVIETNLGLDFTEKYFCSELISEAYRAAGFDLVSAPASAAPSDWPQLGFLDDVEYVGTLLQKPAGWVPIILPTGP